MIHNLDVVGKYSIPHGEHMFVIWKYIIIALMNYNSFILVLILKE